MGLGSNRSTVSPVAAVLLASVMTGAAADIGTEEREETSDATGISSVDEAAIRAAMDELDLSTENVARDVNDSLARLDGHEEIRRQAVQAIHEGRLADAAVTLSTTELTQINLYCSERGMTPTVDKWVWAIPRAMECEDQTGEHFPPEETASQHDDRYDAYMDVLPTEVKVCKDISNHRDGDHLAKLSIETLMAAEAQDAGGDALTIGLGYPWDNGAPNPTMTIHGFDQGDGDSPGETGRLSTTFGGLCDVTYFSGQARLSFVEGSLSDDERIRYTHGNYGGESTYAELVSDGTNTDVSVDIRATDHSAGYSWGTFPSWGLTFKEIEGDFLKLVGEVDTVGGDIRFQGCDIGTNGGACDRLGDTVTPVELEYMKIDKSEGGGTAHELRLELGMAQPTFEIRGNVDGSSEQFSFLIEGLPEEGWLRYDSGDDDNGFASIDLTKRYDRHAGHFEYVHLQGTVDDGEKRMELTGRELDRFRFGFGDDDGAPHGPSSGENTKVTELTANHANSNGYANAYGENTTSGISFEQWLREVDSSTYDWRYVVNDDIAASHEEADGENKTAEVDPPGKDGIFLTFLGQTEDDDGWLAFEQLDSGKWPCVYHIPTPWWMPGDATCA